MANLIIDAIGRPVEIDPTQWADLKASISTGMQGVVGEIKEFKSNHKSASDFDGAKLAEIANHLQTLNTAYAEQMTQIKVAMKEMAQNLKAAGTGTSAAPEGADREGMDFSSMIANTQVMTDLMGKVQQDIGGLAGIFGKFEKAFGTMNSSLADVRNAGAGTTGFFTHDRTTHDILKHIQKSLKESVGETNLTGVSTPRTSLPAAAHTASPHVAGGGSSDAELESLERFMDAQSRADTVGKKREKDWEALSARANFYSALQRGLDSASQSLLGLSKDMSLFGSTFGGMIGKSVDFKKEVRSIAYETQGITGNMQKLQGQMADMGKSSFITGFDRAFTEAEYLKYLKSGIKDQKKALQLATTQLHTEKQLGLEAGELGDEFRKWSNAYNMSNMQIAEMGRGMRDVARYTGLTGKELAQAVKSSDMFIDSMRSAASFTTSAAKNLMEISANSQKMGTAKSMEPLLKALSSTTELYYNSSDQTKAFLFQAAHQAKLTEKLQQGIVMNSKADIKAMSQGMKDIIEKNFLKGKKFEDIENMSAQEKMEINLQMKKGVGFELGDAVNQMKTWEESSKTIGDRLKDLNEKYKGNLTLEEKTAKAQEEARLKASLDFGMLTALDEASKGAKDMNEILAKFGKKKDGFEEDLKSMGKSWTSNGAVARDAIDSALKGVNESRKQNNLSELKIDSSEIDQALSSQDPKLLQKVLGKLTKAQQESAAVEKKNTSPMAQTEYLINTTNDLLRGLSADTLEGYMNMTGMLGMLAPALALTIGSYMISVTKMFGGLGKLLGIKKGANAAPAIAHGTEVAHTATTAAHGVEGAAHGAEAGAAGARAAKGGGFMSKLPWAKSGRQAAIAIKKAGNQANRAIVTTGKTLSKNIEKFGSSWKNAGAVVMDAWKLQWKMINTTGAGIAKGFKEIGKLVRSGGAAVVADMGRIAEGVKSSKMVTSLGELKTVLKGKSWGEMLKSVTNGVKELPTVVGKGISRTAKGVGTATEVAAKGLGAVAKVGSKFGAQFVKIAGGPFTLAAFAVIDGIMGITEAGANAAKIFGKESIKDVTMQQEYSAKSAGLVTGILRTLSLGLLDLLDLLGIINLEEWTAGMAKFFDQFPIITAALSILVVPLEAVWGVIKGLALGIWDILKGLWDGVMNIVYPILEGFTDLFNTLGSMFGSSEKTAGGVGALTNAFRDLGGVVGIVAAPIRFLGTAIGWLFKAIGSVIGYLLKVIFKLVEGLMVVFEPLVEVFSAFGDALADVWNGVADVFGGIGEIFSPLINFIGSLIGVSGEGKSMFGGFLDVVKTVGKVIGYVGGMILKVVIWPLMILAKVLSGIGKLISAIVKMFKGDFGGASALVKSAIMGIIDAIVWPFKELLGWIGVTADAIYAPIEWVAKAISDTLQPVIDIVKILFNDWLGEMGQALSQAWNTIKEPIQEIGAMFSSLGTEIMAVLNPIWEEIQYLALGVKTLWNEVIGSIWKTLKPVWDKVKGALKKVWDVVWPVIKVIGMVVGAIAAFMYLGPVIAVVGAVIAVLMILPKVIGFLAKAIGFLLRLAIWPFTAAIKVFTGIFQMFQGKFLDGIWTIIDGIIAPFKWLWEVLVGHSIVPDIVEGIVWWFKLLWKTISKIVGILAKIFKPVVQFLQFVFAGAVAAISDYLGGLYDVIMGIVNLDFSRILDGLGKAFLTLPKLIFEGLKNIGTWLWNNIIEKMTGWGQWLWDNTIKKMTGWGQWLWDNTIGAIAKIGDTFLDTFTSVFKKLVEAVIGMIPGGGALLDTAKAAGATREENEKRRQETGGGFTTGLGQAAGGVMDLDLGKATDGLKEAGGAVVGGVKSFFNSINPFAAGATEISQSGLGILHAGESVVPAAAMDRLTAVGDPMVGNPSGLAGMGGIGSMISAALSGQGGMGGVGSGLMSAITQTPGLNSTVLGGGVPGAGMPPSIPEARLPQTAVHTAATNANVQSQIMQDRATSSPPTASTAAVGDSSTLQSIVQDGNVTQEGILAVLQAMLEMMKPKSGGGGAEPGDTRTNGKPTSPASYWRSPTGDFNSTSGKGVTNMARMR